MAGAKRAVAAVGPVMRKPEPKVEAAATKKAKPGWCKFQSRARSYVEGVLLEDAEQEITLSPAGSYRQRNSKVLYLVEGDVPVFDTEINKEAQPKEWREAEALFIDDLDDGDPKVGAAPGGLKLIKQG